MKTIFKRNIKGFTIIELLIVVAIIAIIAALALPSYEQYVLKTRRVDAANSLLRIQAEQEKFYFDNNTYMSAAVFATQNNTNNWFEADGGTIVSEGGFYGLTITVSGDSFQDGFSATARPLATSSQQRDTDCTSLSINSSGQRSAQGADTEKCWQ